MDSTILTTEELKKMIDNNEKFVLIDVREKEELNHGMIPGAEHLSSQEIENAFSLDENEFKEKYGFEKPKNLPARRESPWPR